MFLLARTRSASLRFWTCLVGLSVVITFPLGFLRSDPLPSDKASPASKEPAVSMPITPELAKNPVQLTLLPDPT